MASSDRSHPHGARLSMIPVYLRSGEASSSSTRRASLPNPPQKKSSESRNTSRKSVIHDLSESSFSNPNSHRPTFVASPNRPSPPNSSTPFRQRFSGKPDPRRILATLERLARPGLNVYELIDIHRLLEIHEQDLADIAEREDKVKGKWHVDGSETAIFGMPLREAAKYASTTALFNGNQLHLPLVVFDCVEELYRTGIYQQDLFRVLPNRQRLAELIHIFNSTNPHLNYRSKNRRNKVAEYNTTLLHLESTQDICALLIDYLCSIPEPILPTYLFDPMWKLGGVCGDMDEDNLEVGGDAASFINESQCRANFFPLSKFHPEEPSEARRISIVQHLLCLLPSPNFSMLVYLLAFFSHVVMMRDVNGMDIQELGRLFGKCVFGDGSASWRSSPSRNYEPTGKERKTGQAMMCWFLKRWGPISNGLFDVVSVRAEQGRPPVVIGGRVKPKSPIDLNSRPSPSAWLSTKKSNKDVEWSMTLLSPKAQSSFTVMSSPSLHSVSSPKSYFCIVEETARDKEILSGPGILRKNFRNDYMDEQGTGLVKPSATPVEKRSTPASINSAADIDERLLDVSFSPLFNDLHVFDAILPGDAESRPATSNGTPEMPSEVVEDKISLTGVPDTGPEVTQALGRIRDLERQLDRNDTMLGAALEIMFRAKQRVDEIDDRLKELEVTLRVSSTSNLPQRGRPGLGLCLQGSDEENAVDLWREHQKAHDIVVELRRLMLGEL